MQVHDAVLAADAVEEHLDRRGGEPAGEHLAVVSEDLLRDTVSAQRLSQPVADLLRRLAGHQVRAHAEPRVIIDAGQCLGAGAVGEREPAHDVHLPQLHRRTAFPAFPLAIARTPRRRVDQVQPNQRPVGRRLRHRRSDTTLAQLKTQPARTPRRMRQPQLHQRHLDRRRHLMRTRPRPMRPVRQPVQPTGLILDQPHVHRLTRHPEPGSHTRHRLTVGKHRTHGLIPLLSHRQLPHAPGVSPINRTSRNPSPETPSPITRRPNESPQPKAHRGLVGRVGLEPTTQGL